MNPNDWADAIIKLLAVNWYWVLLVAGLVGYFIYALTLKWRPRK